ncbi:hypothetical protein AAG570_011602 [Ranatra chinensis]|uniref:Uncharacterized protein n=1 Tax=Ranatra chinensis TaxID=642074 RepID=A0ABD0YZA3_9HEMI
MIKLANDLPSGNLSPEGQSGDLYGDRSKAPPALRRRPLERATGDQPSPEDIAYLFRVRLNPCVRTLRWILAGLSVGMAKKPTIVLQRLLEDRKGPRHIYNSDGAGTSFIKGYQVLNKMLVLGEKCMNICQATGKQYPSVDLTG